MSRLKNASITLSEVDRLCALANVAVECAAVPTTHGSAAIIQADTKVLPRENPQCYIDSKN